jgi:hypothetical protein
MSIDYLPPPTQTPERNQSGFENSVSKLHLAEASIERAFESLPMPVSYVPPHEILQSRMNEIHTSVMPRIAEEFEEVARKIGLIDEELKRLAEKQQILRETREDLGLFGRSPLPREGAEESTHLVSALMEARAELDTEYESVRKDRVTAGIELERLEQLDFKLLRKGQ